MSSAVDGRSSPLSRVLFLSETGEPMRFFLRPGTTKVRLQPIISAGGGVVCKVQEPNAILLMDPEERDEVPVRNCARYVSSQYILDCVEKNQQLEVDDYRFRDDGVQMKSAKSESRGNGRMRYSAEEDAAILRFVRGRLHEVCGNRLWQEMERKAVTSHSWQSMKARYRKLQEKQLVEGDAEEEPTVRASKESPPPLAADATQLSPEEEDTNRSPERTRPQPPPEPTSPRSSSSERPLPQCSPEKIQPRPSLGGRHPQLILDRICLQPATEENVPQTDRTAPLLRLDETRPRVVPEAVRSRSSAAQGNSVGRKEDAPNTKSTGKNGQLVVTEQVVVEEDEQRPTPKKRKLGILERAVKEFEDSDESDDDDDTPDLALSSTVSAAREALGKDICALTSAEVILLDDEEDDHDNNKDNAAPQPEKASDVQPGPSDKDDGSESVSGPAPEASEPLTSKVHMFLFDQEWQEREPPQPACDALFAQAQVEHGKEQLRYLMKESRRGLGSVTKSLLKNSGDVQAALRYLLNGQHGHLWDPRDDSLLRSAGSLLKLEEKYGKVAVARRIAFLDME